MDIIINVTENPLERHILGYFTTEDGGRIDLWVVENVYYQHPDGPCDLQRIETRKIDFADIRQRKNSEIILLRHIQASILEKHKDK